MRGVSAQSLDTVLQRTRQIIADADDLHALAREIFEIVAAIDSSNLLVRVLSDAGRPSEVKSGMVRSLLGQRVRPQALQITEEVAARRWSEQHHVLEALELAGAYVVLSDAAASGHAETVEGELFQFARLVEETPELSQAFDATRDRSQERVALVRELLRSRAHEGTQIIAEQAVAFDTMRKVPARLDHFASFASELRKRRIGVVTSAIAMTAQQQERLGRILTHKYGTGISLNFEIDPDVVGGMQITIGDDLYDSTIAGRLRDARAQLSA